MVAYAGLSEPAHVPGLYNRGMKIRQKSARRGRALLGAASICLLLAAIVLAVGYEYKHFYEFLVGGLAGLQGALLWGAVSKRTYIISFAAFLLLGVLGDLFFGIFLTELWRYNYAHVWEYLPLYLWVYPVAGICMFQSYLLVRRLFKNAPLPAGKADEGRQTVILAAAAVPLVPLTVWLAISDSLAVLAVHFIYITSLFVAFFGYLSHRRGKASLVDDLFKNPLAVAASLVAATYLNLLLHELPNTRAWEWVYAGVPWQTVQILHIPVAVFPGWLALSLLPVAWFYAVGEKDSK